MPRKKKDYITLNMKVDAEVMRRFNEYCEEVGQTKTLAFERIVSDFMKKRYKEK